MALALLAALIGGLWLVLATTPARDRPIAGAFLLTGRRELSRFRAATGRRLPPRTAWGMRRWLRSVAESADNRAVRATYLVSLGQYDEAAAVVGRIEPGGPFERFQRARLGAIVDFERGGAGDLGPARQCFGAIDDPDDRAIAAWQLAVEDARQRYVLGGDWRAPLELAAGAGDPRARSVQGLAADGHLGRRPGPPGDLPPGARRGAAGYRQRRLRGRDRTESRIRRPARRPDGRAPGRFADPARGKSELFSAG